MVKKSEQEAIKNAADIKAHNEKIDALIFQKQEAKLTEMTVEELTVLWILKINKIKLNITAAGWRCGGLRKPNISVYD